MRMGGSPCLRRRNADGDHTHAFVAQQSHSFPDNLVALLAGIRAWNCSAQNINLFGIAHNLALSVVAEAVGRGVPAIVGPSLHTLLLNHPEARASLGRLPT